MMPQIRTQTKGTTGLPLPPMVRNAWGDEISDVFVEWRDLEIETLMVTRDEYRETLSRMDVLESRMGGLEIRMGSLERAVQQNRLELHQRIDALRTETREQTKSLRVEVQEQTKSLRVEMQEQNQSLRVELKEELREHRRETRIAIEDFRREMKDDFQTLHTQMLVQTRWMIGSLVVIGAMVTLLLTIGMFVK